MERRTSGIMFLLLVLAAARADASTIFLSQSSWYDMFSPPEAENPTITLNLGQTATLHLWAWVGYSDWIEGLGLDVLNATPGIAQASALSFEISELSDTWGPASVEPTAGELMTGMDLDGTSPYVGLPGGNPMWYTGWIPEAILGLHHLGSITVEGLALGSTDVFITTNAGGGVEYRYGGPYVNFGYGDAAVEPWTGPGVASSLWDARIVVVPEPAAAGLLAVAALALLKRR